MMELNAFKRYVGLCLLLGQDTPPYQKREPFVQDTLALISGLPSATQLSAQLCESQPPSLDNSAFPVLTGYQASDILSVARDIWSDENVINLSLRLRMMRAANHTHWDRWPVMRFSHESYHETALNSRSLQAHYLRNEWKDAVREGLTFLQTQVPLAPKFETDSYRSQIRVFLYGALETDFFLPQNLRAQLNSLSNDNLIYLSELFESEENDTVPLAELRYSDFEHKSRILFDEILLSSFGNPDMILKAREFISILLFSRGLDASDSIERAVLFHTPEAQGLLRFYYYSRLYVLHTHAGIAPNELLRPHLYESLRSYAAYHASLDTRSQCHFFMFNSGNMLMRIYQEFCQQGRLTPEVFFSMFPQARPPQRENPIEISEMSSQLQSNVVSVAYQDLPGAFVSQLKSLQVDFGSESALSLYEWSRSHISSLYFGTAIEEDTDISGETNTLLGNIYVQIDPQRLNDPVYILGRVAVIAHETYHLQYSRQVLFHHQYRVINERNAFVVGQRIALQGLRAYLQIHPLHVSVGTLVDCLQHFRNGDVNVLNQFSPEERSVIQMIFDTSKDRKSIMATNFVLGFAEDTLELIPEIIIPREDVRSRYPHDLVDQYLDMTNSTHDLFSQRALLVVCRELGLTH